MSSLEARQHVLATAEDVDGFIRDHPNAAVFKAGACHKNRETFSRVVAHLEDCGAIALGVIRVLEARGASDRVAEVTGIRHESPQIVLFRDHKAVFERNNWDITGDAVREALERHFADVGRPREVVS